MSGAIIIITDQRGTDIYRVHGSAVSAVLHFYTAQVTMFVIGSSLPILQNCDCGGGDQMQRIAVVQSIVEPRLLTTLQLGPRHRSQSAKRKSRQHNIFGFFLGICMGSSKCEPSTHMS